MSETTKVNNYLSTKPGLQIVKAGTYEKKELSGLLGIPGLKSQIIEVPVTGDTNAYQVGFFGMKPGEAFEFNYTFIDTKVVTEGKFVMSDRDGNRYVAEKGDVIIFSPEFPVTFEGESDGYGIYTAHRLPEPSFLPEEKYSSLCQEAGIQIIKKGSLELLELDGLLNIPGLDSQILDVPLTDNVNQLSMGYFAMQPGEEFEIEYTFVELKVVTKGKFVLRDKQGNKYVAEEGDVIVFTPNVPVIFDGESDGEAFYTAHRAADPSFM